MRGDVFETQVKRLVARFGAKAFDQEFTLLIWRECGSMSDVGFSRLVDVLIGSRKHTDPPRLAEFREALHNEQKQKFQADLKAVGTFDTRPMPEVLKRLGYGGCKTLMEAVEVEKLKRRVRRANGEGE